MTPPQYGAATQRRARQGAGVAAAALLLTVAAAPNANAAPTPPCPKGKARVVVGVKVTCVVAGSALPKAPPTQTAGSFVVGASLGGRLDRLSRKAFPPEPKEVTRSPYSTGGAALAPSIETVAKLARASAAKPRIGVPVLTALAALPAALPGGWSTPTTSSTSSRAATTTVSSTSLTSAGTVGTLTATGVVPRQRDGTPDRSRATLEFAVKIDTPSDGVATIAVTQGTAEKVKTNGPCPDAAGRIDVSSNSTISVRTAQEGGGVGFGYIRKNTTTTFNSAFVATVAPDAYLETTSFTVGATVNTVYAASGFGGLIKRNYNITVTARGTGTINGRTGAVSVSSLQVDGAGNELGSSNAETQATIRSAIAGDTAYAEVIARLAADGHERLKEAEKIWREPNKCVNMRFAPASGAKLAAGATQAVDGKMVAKRDGKPTTAVWKAPRITRGSLVGPWPGTSLPTRPLRFTAKGAAPTPAGKTFALTTTATSRAGLASGPWDGTSGGWRVTISGPITGEQGTGIKLASTIKAVVDVRLVTRGGVSEYTAERPFTYTPPVVTQPSVGACLPPPGESFPVPPVYEFKSVAGTADVLIEPDRSAIAPKLKITLTLGDHTIGQITCPGKAPQPLESLLLGLHRFQYPSGVVITVPAAAISTTAVSWSVPAPLAATGALTVKVEPI